MTKNLDNLLKQLELKIPDLEKLNLEISQSNIGWHIEHSLLTLNGITNVLAKSNPKDYKWKFNFTKIVVFTMKHIPRGRGKSPKVVRPKENYTFDSLTQHLSTTKEKIKELKSMRSDAFFQHPVFGQLKLKQTVTFLEIHTKHHLLIINDILKTII